MQKKFIVIGVIGILLIILSAILIAVFPGIVDNQVKDAMKLEEDGGMVFDTWKGVPVPMYIEYYFFNVTNSDDVTFHGAKPNLVEVGPYVYREFRKKDIQSWNETEDTVTYFQTKTYHFDRELSVGDISDTVTIPNVPILSAIDVGIKTQGDRVNEIAAGLIKEKSTLYITKPIGVLLYDGYVDSFIKLLQSRLKEHEIMLPNDTFAFFYGLNGTDDKEYTIYTGKKDSSKFALIKSWNKSEELTTWPNGTTCNKLNGTDGAQFPPFVKKDYIPYAFMSEACRSTYLVYEREVEHFGIKTYRFTSDVKLFADPLVNPDNTCFWEADEWEFTGLQPAAKCQKGAPIYASNPHFYQSDPLLLTAVNGLNPEKEKHQVILDIEPMTGLVLNAAKRAQVNILMKPEFLLTSADLLHFSRMPKLYHPVFWFTERATIDEENVAKFKDMAVTPVKIGTGVIYSILAIGILLVLVIVGIIIWKKKSNKRIPNTSSEMRLQASSNGHIQRPVKPSLETV